MNGETPEYDHEGQVFTDTTQNTKNEIKLSVVNQKEGLGGNKTKSSARGATSITKTSSKR